MICPGVYNDEPIRVGFGACKVSGSSHLSSRKKLPIANGRHERRGVRKMVTRNGWRVTGRMAHDPRGNTWTTCDRCDGLTMIGQCAPHRWVTGTGYHTYDGRDRTPTGGRYGATPEIRRAKHTTTTSGEYVCPTCRNRS